LRRVPGLCWSKPSVSRGRFFGSFARGSNPHTFFKSRSRYQMLRRKSPQTMECISPKQPSEFLLLFKIQSLETRSWGLATYADQVDFENPGAFPVLSTLLKALVISKAKPRCTQSKYAVPVAAHPSLDLSAVLWRRWNAGAGRERREGRRELSQRKARSQL
jgi:hypothetical protein